MRRLIAVVVSLFAVAPTTAAASPEDTIAKLNAVRAAVGAPTLQHDPALGSALGRWQMDAHGDPVYDGHCAIDCYTYFYDNGDDFDEADSPLKIARDAGRAVVAHDLTLDSAEVELVLQIPAVQASLLDPRLERWGAAPGPEGTPVLLIAGDGAQRQRGLYLGRMSAGRLVTRPPRDIGGYSGVVAGGDSEFPGPAFSIVDPQISKLRLFDVMSRQAVGAVSRRERGTTWLVAGEPLQAGRRLRVQARSNGRWRTLKTVRTGAGEYGRGTGRAWKVTKGSPQFRAAVRRAVARVRFPHKRFVSRYVTFEHRPGLSSSGLAQIGASAVVIKLQSPDPYLVTHEIGHAVEQLLLPSRARELYSKMVRTSPKAGCLNSAAIYHHCLIYEEFASGFAYAYCRCVNHHPGIEGRRISEKRFRGFIARFAAPWESPVTNPDLRLVR